MPRRLFAWAAAFLVLTGSARGQQVVSVVPAVSAVTGAAAVRLAPAVLTASPALPAALTPSAIPLAPSVLPSAAPAAAPTATAVRAQPLRLLFLGPPGVGKTTFGKLAAQDYGMVHISVGELLRVKAAEDPALAEEMSRGDLVDSELVRRVVTERLSQPDVKARGFILDGFPRRPEEVRVIESWLKDGNHIDAMVHLEASDKELLRRILARGRTDDSEEVFRKRLEIYRSQTRPVLEHFRSRLNVLEAVTDGPDVPANYAKVRALLDGLFDGGSSSARPAEITRRLAHGRYEASTPRARIAFTLREGLLKTEAAGRDAGTVFDSNAELSRALGAFGRGVRAVAGEWARETAHAAGFTAAVVENGETVFVRPEDVLHDRAGRAWRRTIKQSLRGAEWHRYERDGRIVWLVRRADKDSVSVYEYEGREIPKSGTPAPRRAIFAHRDGRLISHIVAQGAVLLDVAAETRAASEALIR